MSATRITLTVALSLVVAGLLTNAAQAQRTDLLETAFVAQPRFDGYGRRAATVGESYMLGRAAVIDAVGRNNFLTAKARILNQQAYSLALDNQVKKSEKFWEGRYLREQKREEERARKQESRAEGRQLLAQRQASYYRTVYNLSAQQLDHATGRIEWPAALRDAHFKVSRQQINLMLRQRAMYISAGEDAYAERIFDLAESMKQDLKELSQSMDKSDYLEAQRFLLGLKYEMVYPEQVG